MTPQIAQCEGILLAGIKRTMSLANNETFKLWQSFMPIRKGLKDLTGPELYSVEVYPEDYYLNFSPARVFEKWAAAPVSNEYQADYPLQILEIPEGLYAVFPYKGKSSEVYKAYQYIFQQWMPQSEYEVDHRPHFGVMGEKYRNDHPDSEEELWIPIKSKTP